jgi:hypothetical protein
MTYSSKPISLFETIVPEPSDLIPVVRPNESGVKNKKTLVSQIFRAVPYTSGVSVPSFSFQGSATGINSTGLENLSFNINASKINLTNSGGKLLVAVSNSLINPFNIEYQNTGETSLLSTINVIDTNFFIKNSSNKPISFSLSNINASRTFSFPNSSGELVTTTATQTLSNKTLSSPVSTGTFRSAVVFNDINIGKRLVVSSTSGVLTLDVNQATVFDVTLTENITNFNIIDYSNPTSDNYYLKIFLIVRNTTTQYTITGLDDYNSLGFTASEKHIIEISTFDNGTTYISNYIQSF